MTGHDSDRSLGYSTLKPFASADEFPLPLSSTVHVEFGAQTTRGTSHSVNEDHYLVIELGRYQETLMSNLPDDALAQRFEEFGYGMVVADGIGAAENAPLASRLAIVTLVHLVRHFGKWNLRVDNRTAREIMERAERFYRHLDSTMVYEAQAGRLPGGLQTTLTAVFGAGRDLFFAHVGHSRAYLFREGALLRLTRDHTLTGRPAPETPVAPLVDIKLEARDLLHTLTDTVGMGGTLGPQIDIERFQIDDKDLVLVCTNGVTDVLDDHAMAEILAVDGSAEERCDALIERVRLRGGEDDATAVIARYRIPEHV